MKSIETITGPVSVPVAAATAVRGTLSSPSDLETSAVEQVETTTSGDQ